MTGILLLLYAFKNTIWNLLKLESSFSKCYKSNKYWRCSYLLATKSNARDRTVLLYVDAKYFCMSVVVSDQRKCPAHRKRRNMFAEKSISYAQGNIEKGSRSIKRIWKCLCGYKGNLLCNNPTADYIIPTLRRRWIWTTPNIL